MNKSKEKYESNIHKPIIMQMLNFNQKFLLLMIKKTKKNWDE